MNENVIRACVNAQGSIRIVAPGEQCREDETPLEWNTATPPADAAQAGPRVSFRAVKEGLQEAAPALVRYDEVIFDEGGNYDPQEGAFTAPTDGVYHFDAAVQFVQTLDAGLSKPASISILVEDDLIQRLGRLEPLATSGDFTSVRTIFGGGTTLKLAAGNRVRVMIESGLTEQANSSSWVFSGFQVY